MLTIAHAINYVMSLATETDMAALYIEAREALYIHIVLEEIGHTQPSTSLQTNDSMADFVVNGKVQSE
jgi:hypothetical protein